MKRAEMWPMILRTEPPTIMTREEAYAKVPYMRIIHFPATLPREERIDRADLPRK
jgi:hypothetical protein